MNKYTPIMPVLAVAGMLQACGGGGAGGSNFDLYAENMKVDAGQNVATSADSVVNLIGRAYNENRMIKSMQWSITRRPNDNKIKIEFLGGERCDAIANDAPDDNTTPELGGNTTPEVTTANNAESNTQSQPSGAGHGDWKDVMNCATALYVGPVIEETPITLMLTATDETGHTASDEVTIYVRPNNNPFVVDAGPDLNIGPGQEITSPCHYSGGFWYDPQNPQPHYRWSLRNGEDLLLQNVSLSLSWDETTGVMTLRTPDNLTRNVDALLACEVTDESGQVAEDTATYHISALEPLIANAGEPQVVNINQIVTLDASRTRDPLNRNQPIYYQWSQVSGTPVQITGANDVQASFVAPGEPCELVFQVSVSREPITENTVFATTERAVTTVRVQSTPPLTVSAGDSQTVEQGTSVILSATVNDPSGYSGPYYYQWEQIGGSAVTLANENTSNASFVAPNVEDTLTFRVSVSREPITADTVFATTERAITTVTVVAPKQP